MPARTHAGALAPPLLPEIKVRSARRIITASGARARGMHRSFRYEKWLQWESSLESAALIRFEFTRHISDVWTQPYCITIPEGDFEYTPDMLVLSALGQPIYIECKLQRELEHPEIAERIATINRFFVGRGANFLTLNEHQLFDDIVLSNIRDLLRHRRIALRSGDLANYRQQIETTSPTTLDALLGAVPSPVAMHALARGWLHFDFHQRLDKTTPLFQNWIGEYDAATFMEPR